MVANDACCACKALIEDDVEDEIVDDDMCVSDNTTGDRDGDTCEYYSGTYFDTSECGLYDTDLFKATI